MDAWAASVFTAVQGREACLCDVILRSTFGAVMGTRKPLRLQRLLVPFPKLLFVSMAYI